MHQKAGALPDTARTDRGPLSIYPPFTVAFPILALLSANMSSVPFHDVWRPLLVAEFAVLILWLLASLALRSITKGAFFAGIAVGLFFAYGEVHRFFPSTSPMLFDGVYGVVSLGILGALLRLHPPVRALNAIAALLVFVSSSSIAYQAFTPASGLKVAAGANPGRKFSSGPLPDIFYIVLDGFGRTDSLQRFMGYDDSEFVKHLEDAGFYVAQKSRSNYNHTSLSLTSSLNLDLIPELFPKLPTDFGGQEPLNAAISGPRLESFLRQHGYRTIALKSSFPTFNYLGFQSVVSEPQDLTLFELQLLEMTPLRFRKQRLEKVVDQHRNSILAAFQNLGSLAPTTNQPKFVLAHVLAPHPPFVFGKNGESIEAKRKFDYWDASHFREKGGTLQEYQEGYSNQAQFISKLTLSAVKKLIAGAKRPPIIIVQGDHGSRSHLDWQGLENTEVGECFPILNAYFVPREIEEKLYPDITPVNSFP